MNNSDFFNKYMDFFTDNSNDARGVFGKMDKRALVLYPEFRQDIVSSSELPILVEYYHSSKPYFWGKPSEFPYTQEFGPGPEEKPYIIKRGLNWYIVPEKCKPFEPMCFSVLKWEFEVSILVFQNEFIQNRIIHPDSDVFNLVVRFSKIEIDSFFEKEVIQHEP